MIELAMIFALGVLVASLLALLILPFVSRRAIRLATRRLELTMPLSMAEIVAERDQIRAEHAAATRRLEQKLEASARTQAGLMGENGRHVTRLLGLETALAEARAQIAALTTDLEGATRATREAEAGFAGQTQALHDTLGLAERRLDRLRATEAQLAESETTAEERRGIIAALETRGTGQDLRIRIAQSQAAKAVEDLSRAQSAIAAARAERDINRAEAALAAEDREMLQGALDAERQKVVRAEARHADLADQLAAQAARTAEQQGDLAASQRFLSAANARYESLAAEHDALKAERDRLVRETVHAPALAEQTPGALTSAGTAPVPPAGPTTVADDGIASLREAITFIAGELLRAGEAQPARPAKAAPAEVPEQAVLPFLPAKGREGARRAP